MLKNAVKHLIENCFFTVANITLKQDIGIPRGIDLVPFWAYLCLYFYENQIMKELFSNNKIKSRHFHSTKRFINDFCTTNEGGEFGRTNPDIYPKELELKPEHQSTAALLLQVDINIVDGDSHPFFILRMPHIDSNILNNIF